MAEENELDATVIVTSDSDNTQVKDNPLAVYWASHVASTKGKWSDTFKRMRDDMKFALGYQWPGQSSVTDEERYVVNVTQRHVMQKTASLYAKNPTFVASRRRSMDFEVWDGDMSSLRSAEQMVMAAKRNPQLLQSPMLAQSLQLAQDAMQGGKQREQLDRISETLEILFQQELERQDPVFKQRAKSLVRRTITTGVGFVKLGFHRKLERKPEDEDRVTDLTEQLAYAERLAEEATDDTSLGDAEKDVEQLRYLLDSIRQTAGEQIIDEGLSFDFPKSTSLIVDKDCISLNGFVGAQWVAQEFLLTPDQVREIYGVKLAGQFSAYKPSADGYATGHKPGMGNAPSEDAKAKANGQARAAVYEVYDKKSGTMMTVCEGYPQFLTEPEAPALGLKRFWPFFTLMFNEAETEEHIYPLSDVQALKAMQRELNLSRDRLREHRDAARPDWVSSLAGLDEKDAKLLQSSGAFRLLRMKSLQPNQKITDLLQPKPTHGIDPNLYQTAYIYDDIYKTVGAQEANFGGTSGATATEVSVAQSSMATTMDASADQLDDFLSDLARSSGEALLGNMSRETVVKLVGRGAVWPEMAAASVATAIRLDVRAGSSGRPNRAQEIQSLERVMPFLLQLPGVSPYWLLEQIVHRLDDKIDLSDAYLAGAESVIAQNAMAQPATGNPETEPTEQGGGDNAPRQPQSSTNQGPNNATSGAPGTDVTGQPETSPLRSAG